MLRFVRKDLSVYHRQTDSLAMTKFGFPKRRPRFFALIKDLIAYHSQPTSVMIKIGCLKRKSRFFAGGFAKTYAAGICFVE